MGEREFVAGGEGDGEKCRGFRESDKEFAAVYLISVASQLKNYGSNNHPVQNDPTPQQPVGPHPIPALQPPIDEPALEP
jgi:hypothetical protein